MNLKKTIAKVFSANVIQLVTGIIVGLWLPSILSIDGYANEKTYTLLVSYIGFLHFGFIDGLYIKYGGKKTENINKATLKGEYYFLLIAESILSIILVIISITVKNTILLLFSLTILPIMIYAFFRYYFQAVGEFKKYTIIMYLYSLIYLIANILLIFIIKSDNYIWYALCTIISYIIAGLIYHFELIKKLRGIKPTFDRKNLLNVTKVGIFILLGNLSIVGLFSIDKWFIKIFFTTEDFAYYSFAVSMLNIINTLVSAISVVFYNYLCNNNTEKNINKIKDYLMILGGIASGAYFILSFIVKKYLVKYIPSLDIISITFSTLPYMVLINALYVNLYKVNKNEKKYLKVVSIMLLISIIYNFIAVIVFKTTSAVALATVLTMLTWAIYSTIDLPKVKFNWKIPVFLLILTISFILITHIMDNLVGMLIYYIILIADIYIFSDVNIKEIFNDIKNF